ncbi:unknown [Euproctis pseudoconspersa nucleopolyhedrovirus]|uniref:Ac117 n=1 Tax=Euproctis pseudoconspersa nucleopolyhedrovirus TaxID=307467 RepID=C3TX13_9ABAC|nr:hypothetical protein EupsNPV_gp105 [Euproctis pseudoconspersa nucleopolyhedrovirus]ACO53555.1 unknown [Euproctis pseudoconspersa nucleopolyhedrovirus]QUJ09295.1 hypothetical protein Gyru_ORF100 [Gynaephora ruoergensis nucleopolyhedrovirus]
MKLIAFVIHIANPDNLLQKTIYEKYLINFDVIDAVMCKNGECLAICLSSVVSGSSNIPKCYNNFVKKTRNDGVCSITIMDTAEYENLDVLQDLVFYICEKFNA